MKHIRSFDKLYEYVDLKSAYYLHDKKVQIVGTQRRSSEETVYKCMYEDGTFTQVMLSNDEIDEYFIPCPEPFMLTQPKKRVVIIPKATGGEFYDVVLCVVPGKVQQVLKPGLSKSQAFAMMNYFKTESKPGGKYSHYRPQWVQVVKSK